MTKWTLEMRFALLLLFTTFGFDSAIPSEGYDEWFQIFTLLYGTDRTRKVVREDYTQRDGKQKGQIYRNQICKDPQHYTQQEAADKQKAHDKIISAARTLGITLNPTASSPASSVPAPKGPSSSAALAASSTQTNNTSETSNTQAHSLHRQALERSHARRLEVDETDNKLDSHTKQKKTLAEKFNGSAGEDSYEAEFEGAQYEEGFGEEESDEDEPDKKEPSEEEHDEEQPDEEQSDDEESDEEPKKPSQRSTMPKKDRGERAQGETVEPPVSIPNKKRKLVTQGEDQSIGESRELRRGRNRFRSTNTLDVTDDTRAQVLDHENVEKKQKIRPHREVCPTPVFPPKEHQTAHEDWTFKQLGRLLLGEPHNLKPWKVLAPEDKAKLHPQQPPTAEDRAADFFTHLFDNEIPREHVLLFVRTALSTGTPIQQLMTIHDMLIDCYKIQPKYQLGESFCSPLSPFHNFRLATAAFRRGLQMLHRSDVDFTGPYGGQPTVFTEMDKRQRFYDEVNFIDINDPVFRRGGRLYTITIRQPDCAVLGSDEDFNTAQVTFDAMLCQADKCPRCSDFADNSPVSVTSLPRMHLRHLKGEKEFQQGQLRYATDDEDEDVAFVESMQGQTVAVKLWDGTRQEVALCELQPCGTCKDKTGLWALTRASRSSGKA